MNDRGWNWKQGLTILPAIIISCHYVARVQWYYYPLDVSPIVIASISIFTGSYGPRSGYGQHLVRAYSPKSPPQSITPTPISVHLPV
jgi:hypothetical protein